MNLTAKELCEIIEACDKAKVTSLKIGDIEVVFDTKPIAAKNSPVQQPSSTDQGQEISNPIKFEEISTNPEVEDAKDSFEELHISDPSRFEELVGQGELVDDDRE